LTFGIFRYPFNERDKAFVLVGHFKPRPSPDRAATLALLRHFLARS
jgi:hypothetical protein